MTGSSSDTGRRGTSTTLTRLTAFPFRPGRARLTALPYDAPPSTDPPRHPRKPAGQDVPRPGSAAADPTPHALPQGRAYGMHQGAARRASKPPMVTVAAACPPGGQCAISRSVISPGNRRRAHSGQLARLVRA